LAMKILPGSQHAAPGAPGQECALDFVN
jgi:hypothetical protein